MTSATTSFHLFEGNFCTSILFQTDSIVVGTEYWVALVDNGRLRQTCGGFCRNHHLKNPLRWKLCASRRPGSRHPKDCRLRFLCERTLPVFKRLSRLIIVHIRIFRVSPCCCFIFLQHWIIWLTDFV